VREISNLELRIAKKRQIIKGAGREKMVCWSNGVLECWIKTWVLGTPFFLLSSLWPFVPLALGS